MFVKSIARGSNYHARTLWITAHSYNLSFRSFFFFFLREGEGDREREELVFMGKEGDRFEVVH